MKLDVYVHSHQVGTLEQTDIASFVFTYLPDTPPELSISLLMPPRTASWTSPFLFPVFQVSLPEGALRHTLEQLLSKHFERFDDMALLSIVGGNLIGQLQVAIAGQIPVRSTLRQSLEQLLTDDLQAIVSLYLEHEPSNPGVSGGFPKLLARSPSAPGEGPNRTLPIDEWIVKLNDPDRPTIVLLEHFGMLAARRMGLPVPETHLAADFSRLLVKRFDIDAKGAALGFEDMCALTGQPARYKFDGSVERILKIIDAFCDGRENLESRERLFAHYLLCTTIRNGDAHLKNFGLLYGGVMRQSPRLAPVYDMLSMSVYAPRRNDGDAADMMALTFRGSKRWLDRKDIRHLGALCHLPPARQEQYFERMGQALLDTADDVIAFQSGHPDAGFGTTGARMLSLWAYGLQQINRTAADRLRQAALALNLDQQ